MAGRVTAGEFEQLFAQHLDGKIRQGAELNSALVKESYEAAGSVLSLPETKADLVHIADIFTALAGRKNELIKLGSERAQKLIFDLIYMH